MPVVADGEQAHAEEQRDAGDVAETDRDMEGAVHVSLAKTSRLRPPPLARYAGLSLARRGVCGLVFPLHAQAISRRYSASTCSRAQGVRRRNLRLDLMLGSFWKQRMLMTEPRLSQP